VADIELADFEEYRILRPLGRGAMGQVFLAHDQLLDRSVAVKVLAATAPTRESRERFLVEARALARLQHPNVVTVYRVGEVDGRPYLVSEFLRGQPLNSLEKPVSWRRVLELGVELARALAAAHRQGVLHRDIKPANAWLTEEGTAKLLDFGLAKLLDTSASVVPLTQGLVAQAPLVSEGLSGSSSGTIESSHQPLEATMTAELVNRQSSALTMAGAVLGSPLYMPPEAWRGEPATRRGDVFSLGVLLYELCVGKAPLASLSAVDIPFRSQTYDAPPLASLVPDLDPVFGAAVDRCLHRDPTRRFESADGLREVLEARFTTRPSIEVFEGNPYRGLMTFEAEHRGAFFGRDAEVRMLVDRLRSERCVVVTADSGIGKSSLCRAGALPALQAGAMGAPKAVAMLVPGRAPLASLAAALSPLLEQAEESLQHQLWHEPNAVGRLLRQRFRHGVVLFVDQLEELVTVSMPTEAQVVALALTTLVEEAPGVQLLAAVRSDFFARVAALGPLSQLTSRALFVLQPMVPDALRQAIVGPAMARGVQFESAAMVDALIGSAEGALPLLQFVLNQLWETRDLHSNVLTHRALEVLGGLEGCLARHGDALLRSLPPTQREAAKQVLLALVTAQGERARKADDELASISEDARPALNALVAGRLILARARQADGLATYELAHEALIQHWGTLRDWLDGTAETRLLLSRLERAAAEWQRLHHPLDSLWGDRQLDELRAVSVAERPVLERDFLSASTRASTRRRRVRWATRVGLPLLLAMSSLPFFKWRYDRAHSLDFYTQQAQTLVLDAERLVEAADLARVEAFRQFDADEATRGEESWAAARKTEDAAESTFLQARNVIEQAALLAPSDPAVEALRDKTITGRMRLADSAHQFERAATLATETLATETLELTPSGHVVLEGLPSDAHWLLTPVSTFGLRVSRAQRNSREGRGPWHGDLGAGAWQLSVERPGLMTTRLPLLVQPTETMRVEAAPTAEVPHGFIFIPPGRFFAGSADDEGLRRFFLKAHPMHERSTGAYLIGRYEVTYGEWIAFLERQSPQRQEALMPNTPDRFNGVSLRRLNGRWQLSIEPSGQRHAALEGQPIRYPGREKRTEQDWLHFPVTAISFDDARAYASWLSKSGKVPNARLCTDLEWERAARGADARRYPHGDAVLPDDINQDITYGRVPTAFGPDEVGSHPASRSPFGVDDLSGNVWEMVVGTNGRPVLRGGSWYQGALSAQIANREESEANNRDPLVGFRVCADAVALLMSDQP